MFNPIYKRNSGFTLIELLIVVAIIGILAAIAIPNFLEAQTRAKVSRVVADMRTMATGMEMYLVDHNEYPTSLRFSPLPPNPFADGMDTRLLTTPVSYITNLPIDVFRPELPEGYYVWGTNLNVYGSHHMGGTVNYTEPFNSWMAWSWGPDRESQTGGYRPLEVIRENEAQLPVFFAPYYNGMRYDPTNGTVSTGDIYRFGSAAESQKF